MLTPNPQAEASFATIDASDEVHQALLVASAASTVLAAVGYKSETREGKLCFVLEPVDRDAQDRCRRASEDIALVASKLVSQAGGKAAVPAAVREWLPPDSPGEELIAALVHGAYMWYCHTSTDTRTLERVYRVSKSRHE